MVDSVFGKMLLQLQKVGLILLQLFAGSEKMQPVMKPKVVSMSVIKDSLVQHGTHHFRFEYPGEGKHLAHPTLDETETLLLVWCLWLELSEDDTCVCSFL